MHSRYYVNNNVDPVTVSLIHPAAIEPVAKKHEPLTKPFSVARALPLPPVSQSTGRALERQLYPTSTRLSVIDPTIDLEGLNESLAPQDTVPIQLSSLQVLSSVPPQPPSNHSLPAPFPNTTLPPMQHIDNKKRYSEIPASTAMSLYNSAIGGQPALERSNVMRSTHTASTNTATQTHQRCESCTTNYVSSIGNSASISPGQPASYLTTTARPPTEQTAMYFSSDVANQAGNLLPFSISGSAPSPLGVDYASAGPIPSTAVTLPISSTAIVFPYPSMPSNSLPQPLLPYVSSNIQLPSVTDTTTATSSKKSRKESAMQTGKTLGRVAAHTSLHVAGGFISGATGIPSSVITSLGGIFFNKKLTGMFKAAFSKKSARNVTESDLHAVMQGRPDANYQVVIDALIQQQQQQRLAQERVDGKWQNQLLDQSTIDFSSLIMEIQRLQKVAEVQKAYYQFAQQQLHSHQGALAQLETRVIQQHRDQALVHSCQPQPHSIPAQQLLTVSQLQPQRTGASQHQVLPQVQSLLQQQQREINALAQQQALASQQQQQEHATIQQILQEQRRQIAISSQIAHQLQQQAASNLQAIQSANRPQLRQEGPCALAFNEKMRQQLQQQQALSQVAQNLDMNQLEDISNVQVAINENFQGVEQGNLNLQTSDQYFQNGTYFPEESQDRQTFNFLIQNTTQASQQQPSLAGMSDSSSLSEILGQTSQAPIFDPRDMYPDLVNNLDSANEGSYDLVDNFSNLSLEGGTTLGSFSDAIEGFD